MSETVHSMKLDSHAPDLIELDRAWEKRLSVNVSDAVWSRVQASRERIEKISAGDAAVYGVNTGFGHLCTKRIDRSQIDQLQLNLVISHAVGVGPNALDAIVRFMMLLKIQALAFGYSGVRTETIRRLAEFLNHDFLPIVPTQGSLGASGDLAPLAHMVLPMLGIGNVRHDGREMPATEALAQLNCEPLVLSSKEGLALINGTQFMLAYAAAMVVRARRLIKQADILACMSIEGLQGSIKPFAEKLHALRPHPGAIATSDNVRKMLAGSRILEAHANCTKVQDPYSLRCVPQVHGATRQAIEHVASVVEIEIASVTDNPVIFEDGETISGGLFHGQPLAIAMDYLAIAIAELGSICERRIFLLLDGHDGLPELLMQETGLNSGFMLPQYTAAALVSENKGLCHPASVDSIPTSLGQEDHVSMGATAATKGWRVLDNVETVLAIEAMCAAQALDFRAPLEPGIGVKIAHKVIREYIPHADADRMFGEDIRCARQLLHEEKLVAAIEKELGELY
ncbi:MAG TPA: histidine ammonia-lyase [Phycisphaerae bacterium]|nr:histidine ammonia-lyase [Phycisphaerae bacterium]